MNMDTQTRRQLHHWLSLLLDDQLSEPEQQRLGGLLRHSAEARALYLAYCDLHLDLMLRTEIPPALDGLAGAGSLATDPTRVSPSLDVMTTGLAPPQGQPAAAPAATWDWFSWPVAVGTVVAAVLLVAVWFRPHQLPVSVASLGQVVQQHEAVWAPSRSAPAMSKALVAGPVELRSGSARLKMSCGAVVTLQGPATIELIDAKAVRLFSGAITVEAPDSAVGFRVLTPTADVVDLGTEFNVAVDPAGATEIHVSQGVVVARSSGSDAVVPIVRGEAGRIDIDQGDLVPTAFDSTRFPRLTTAAPHASRLRQKEHPRLPPGSRIVFLGDQATDRETHLLLINQAFSRLPQEDRPQLFNAGICFPLLFDEADFTRQLRPFAATHAVLEFGSDLARLSGKHLLSQARFEHAILRLCERLEEEGIEPIITTGFPLDKKFGDAAAILQRYNTFLRDLAAQRGYRLADYELQFQDPTIAETLLLAVNGYLPSFEGHRQLAKSLLAAWGHADAEVDETLMLSLLPGAVTQWRYRYKAADERLNAAMVGKLELDATWTPLSLPQADDRFARRMADRTHSISYRDRTRGFATHLFRQESHGVEAMASVHSDRERDAFINTGATLQSVWLNGEQVYQNRGWSGWHAGKERVAVRLRQGENNIVIEAGNSFFLSITDQHDWALP